MSIGTCIQQLYIFREEYQGLITYYLPDLGMPWSRMFGVMEYAKRELHVEDYSITQTTLEQIFLRFTKYQKPEGSEGDQENRQDKKKAIWKKWKRLNRKRKFYMEKFDMQQFRRNLSEKKIYGIVKRRWKKIKRGLRGLKL